MVWGGHGSAGLMVRFDILRGLFQPKWFYDSILHQCMKCILRLNVLKLGTPARWSQKLPGSSSTPNVLGVKRESFHFFSFYNFFKKSPLKLGNKDAISLSNCRTQFKCMSITENKLSWKVPGGHYVCSVCNCLVFILIFQLLFYLFCARFLFASGFFCPYCPCYIIYILQ